jgi:hypothetical protein
MSAINGSQVTVEGSCSLLLDFENTQLSHEFIIAKIGDEGVLGMDFLEKYRCNWDWDERKLQINGHDIKCNLPSPLHTIFHVVAQDDIQLQPQHETIIPGRILGSKTAPCVGLVLGQQKFQEKRGVIVAAVLATNTSSIVPVRVMNPNGVQKKIKAGEEVALYQEVDIMNGEQISTRSRIRKVALDEEVDLSEWTPELQQLYEDSLEGCNKDEREVLKRLLNNYQDVFSSKDDPLGRTGLVQHRIQTVDHPPIKQRPRREPIGMQNTVQKEIKDMLEKGVIEPSQSAWASPVVLVKKKDNSLRFCIDYRRLNDVTIKDAYPLPLIEDNLDALGGSSLYSTLDLASGYWQVEVHPDDREKTAFCTRYGLYQFRVLPFGLCNGPGTFERLMERVLCNLQWDIVLLYLDDIIVFSTNIVQQFERLELVFQRLRAANLKLKPKKCFLFKKEVKFLGHVVSQQGVATDPEKIQAVVEWPTPHSVKAVRAFLGLTGYYRKFIREYASIAVPLTDLTKKGVKFAWNGDAQGAFEYLQQQLVSAPILGYPNKEGGFILDTDASGCSIGCVLSQLQEGVERVIAYGSKKLSKSERNYCVTRRELLSIVWFMEHFKHYLIGRPFLVRTDHNSLRWLFSFKEPEGQVARWLERLSAFNFKIEHRPGIRHGNSDALSRIPCQTPCRY